MNFEFDPKKSAANAEKHKIDFVRAQALWQDPNAADVASPHPGEERRMYIGQAEGKLWTAIYTRRGDKVRLISVRRSRDMEKATYGTE
jgi:uncharacterized DUF497 family protein